jgi:hypothetical protein
MRIALVFLFLALTACATPYQNMGFMGGVEAQRMTADTYRIVARGNGYTGATAIQDYTMLKAAETTKQTGGTHFAIISAADASRTGTVVTPGQVQTSVVGNMAFTTYSPAMAYNYVKPGQDTYIRVFTITPGKPTPQGLFSADEIIQFVGTRVKRPAG